MFKSPLFIAFSLCALQTFSQSQTCSTPEDENLLLDVNSITKCSIKDSKTEADNKSKTRKISVVVSSRKRVVRRKNAINSISNANAAHKIKELKNINNSLAKNLNLTNDLRVIPLGFVDEVPAFKSCKNSPLSQQEKCFKKELSNHVRKHFKYPANAYDNAVQGKVLVYFTIDKDGSIDKMKIKAPYKGEELAEEAKRIMGKLPKLSPGKHSGQNVTVRYGFPITFKIPGTKPSNIKKESKKINLNEVYSFNEIETIPQFTSCKKSNNTSLKCYNENLVKHIQENFAYPKRAVDNEIEGVVDVNFVINKKGKVVNIETKGPKGGKILEIAAKGLIEKLPKFKAGNKNGNPVNVKYSFPVTFTLN